MEAIGGEINEVIRKDKTQVRAMEMMALMDKDNNCIGIVAKDGIKPVVWNITKDLIALFKASV